MGGTVRATGDASMRSTNRRGTVSCFRESGSVGFVHATSVRQILLFAIARWYSLSYHIRLVQCIDGVSTDCVKQNQSNIPVGQQQLVLDGECLM